MSQIDLIPSKMPYITPPYFAGSNFSRTLRDNRIGNNRYSLLRKENSPLKTDESIDDYKRLILDATVNSPSDGMNDSLVDGEAIEIDLYDDKEEIIRDEDSVEMESEIILTIEPADDVRSALKSKSALEQITAPVKIKTSSDSQVEEKPYIIGLDIESDEIEVENVPPITTVAETHDKEKNNMRPDLEENQKVKELTEEASIATVDAKSNGSLLETFRARTVQYQDETYGATIGESFDKLSEITFETAENVDEKDLKVDNSEVHTNLDEDTSYEEPTEINHSTSEDEDTIEDTLKNLFKDDPKNEECIEDEQFEDEPSLKDIEPDNTSDISEYEKPNEEPLEEEHNEATYTLNSLGGTDISYSNEQSRLEERPIINGLFERFAESKTDYLKAKEQSEPITEEEYDIPMKATTTVSRDTHKNTYSEEANTDTSMYSETDTLQQIVTSEQTEMETVDLISSDQLQAALDKAIKDLPIVSGYNTLKDKLDLQRNILITYNKTGSILLYSKYQYKALPNNVKYIGKQLLDNNEVAHIYSLIDLPKTGKWGAERPAFKNMYQNVIDVLGKITSCTINSATIPYVNIHNVNILTDNEIMAITDTLLKIGVRVDLDTAALKITI